MVPIHASAKNRMSLACGTAGRRESPMPNIPNALLQQYVKLTEFLGAEIGRAHV